TFNQTSSLARSSSHLSGAAAFRNCLDAAICRTRNGAGSVGEEGIVNRRHVFTFGFSMLFLVIGCAFAGKAQSRLRGRQPQFAEHPVCSEELDETREQRAAHLSFASYLRYETGCVSESDERWNLPGDRPGIERAPEPDPI